jgi:hypothetical protein
VWVAGKFSTVKRIASAAVANDDSRAAADRVCVSP